MPAQPPPFDRELTPGVDHALLRLAQKPAALRYPKPATGDERDERELFHRLHAESPCNHLQQQTTSFDCQRRGAVLQDIEKQLSLPQRQRAIARTLNHLHFGVGVECATEQKDDAMIGEEDVPGG